MQRQKIVQENKIFNSITTLTSHCEMRDLRDKVRTSVIQDVVGVGAQPKLLLLRFKGAEVVLVTDQGASWTSGRRP